MQEELAESVREPRENEENRAEHSRTKAQSAEAQGRGIRTRTLSKTTQHVFHFILNSRQNAAAGLPLAR